MSYGVVVRRVPAAVPGMGCFDPEPDREVGLPGPGWAEEHQVLGGVDEGRGAQVRDRVALECGLVSIAYPVVCQTRVEVPKRQLGDQMPTRSPLAIPAPMRPRASASTSRSSLWA